MLAIKPDLITRIRPWWLKRLLKKELLKFDMGNLWNSGFKYHHMSEFATMPSKEICDKLTGDIGPDSKYIHTSDWGSFKIRKNGRVKLDIGGEIIRVTPNRRAIS